MKAMIFAAGRGERLKPLTNNKPKALVEVNGVPMLELIIKKLISNGVSEIIINVHYLANQIITFLKEKNNFSIRIEISDETDLLLDTGGGLKKSSWFFNDGQPFIIYNTDIISDIDLSQMYQYHKAHNPIATLAIRKRDSSRYFLFNPHEELCGWKNMKSKKEIILKNAEQLFPYAFSGIHIVNPKIFNYMPEDQKFSIVNTYLDVSETNIIKGYLHNQNYWFDIGTPEKLIKAAKFIEKR